MTLSYGAAWEDPVRPVCITGSPGRWPRSQGAASGDPCAGASRDGPTRLAKNAKKTEVTSVFSRISVGFSRLPILGQLL